MGKRIALALILLASTFVSTAHAAAGAPTVTFTYPNKSRSIAPGTKLLAQQVSCPRGSKVVGGGSLVTGFNEGNLLHASAPFDNDDRGTDPDDGWRTIASNLGITWQYLSTWAVCARGASVSYLTAVIELPGGSRQDGDQPCASGHRPTGGGVAIKDPRPQTIIESTYPIDTDDVDSFRNNGWGARVRSEVTKGRLWHLIAICTTSGTLSVQTNSGVVDGGDVESLTTTCPTGYPTTGGGFYSDDDARIDLTGNHPDASDPDGRWNAAAYNASGEVQNVSIWALCMTS